MEIKTAIFHGPSGSGKDTQLDLLEEKIPFERIGASAIMGSLKSERNDVALQADEYGKRGELYPDELVYQMFDIWLARLDPSQRWYFVSPVRKDTQIVLFDELLKKHNRKLDLFIHFSLSEEVAIERMSQRTVCSKCGVAYHKIFKKEKIEGLCDDDGEKLIIREDDTPEAIKQRLAWYQNDITPILSEYRKRGILLEVDATPSIDTIHNDLMEKLENYEENL